MPNPEEAARHARLRAQDQVAAVLRKRRRPQRSVKIPVLQPNPPFAAGINLWLDPAGNLRSYGPDGTLYQYTKTTVTANAGSFPADPQPETLQQTYTADWGRTFCDIHGLETGTPGVWYGDTPTADHTGRKVMLGLPDATIRADLAGANIEAVELTAVNLDAYADAVVLHWGLHNIDAPPAAWSAVWKDAFIDSWPRVGGQGWRQVATGLGALLRDNTAKGLTIDQPAGFGGLLDWTSVQLRITYTV